MVTSFFHHYWDITCMVASHPGASILSYCHAVLQLYSIPDIAFVFCQLHNSNDQPGHEHAPFTSNLRHDFQIPLWQGSWPTPQRVCTWPQTTLRASAQVARSHAWHPFSDKGTGTISWGGACKGAVFLCLHFQSPPQKVPYTRVSSFMCGEALLWCTRSSDVSPLAPWHVCTNIYWLGYMDGWMAS